MFVLLHVCVLITRALWLQGGAVPESQLAAAATLGAQRLEMYSEDRVQAIRNCPKSKKSKDHGRGGKVCRKHSHVFGVSKPFRHVAKL